MTKYYILSKYENNGKNDKCQVLIYLSSEKRLEYYLGTLLVTKIGSLFVKVPNSRMLCVEEENMEYVLNIVSKSLPKEKFVFVQMFISYETLYQCTV